MFCLVVVFAHRNLTSTCRECACMALQGLLTTLSVYAQSTIAHTVKKLFEECVADESEDDGSDTVKKLPRHWMNL